MPAKTGKKYVRNTTTQHFRIRNFIFKPRGTYGDAIPATKEVLSDNIIQDMLKIGKLELTDERAMPEKREPKTVPVTFHKHKNKNVVLTTCLGIKSDGTQCKNQVTFIGDEKAPLCKDHAEQIDQIEFDEITGAWRRKL